MVMFIDVPYLCVSSLEAIYNNHDWGPPSLRLLTIRLKLCIGLLREVARGGSTAHGATRLEPSQPSWPKKSLEEGNTWEYPESTLG